MITLAAVAVVLPFLGAVACASLGGRRGTGRGPAVGGVGSGVGGIGLVGVVAIVPVAVATLLTIIVALDVWTEPGVRAGTLTVVPTGSVPFGIGLYVDGLSAVVACMVCCVALAVQVYSVAYMAADPRYSSYAAFVALSTAAMLLVVLAGDLIVLYVGWEVVGLCSYVLIGHRRADDAAGRAAVRTFFVTRVADVAFLFGIFVLGLGAGTFSVRGVLAYDYPHGTALAGTLLLVVGVAGKSAQFPLHAWLAGTMLGPLPIGALIHAGTMVAAGVYVVARLFPAFLRAPTTLTVLGVIAAISMLGAALAALAQDDLKRVLAYSTISQVAYVATGLAVGARDAAIFHLLAHGAAKALLFLAAGCVITVLGSDLLRDMGGLRLAMPVTFWSMTIGWAALAGVPVAGGFFSTEAIIAAVRRGGGESSGIAAWAAVLVYVTLLVTVAVTGAYAARAWLMTFFGERRTTETDAGRVRGARGVPALMSLPVAALAVPALGLGFCGLGSAGLRPEPVPTILELAMVAAGAGAAFVVWNRDPALDPARLLGRRIRGAFARGFYLDGVGDRVAVRSVRALAGLAGLVAAADDRVVNVAVVGSGRAVRRLGGVLPGTRGGNPQAYVTGLLAGVALIALAVAVFT
jgi:NADH-quinone oxidoreductase subunit L